MIEALLFWIATLTGGMLLGGSLCLWLLPRYMERAERKRRLRRKPIVLDMSDLPPWFWNGDN